MLMLLIPLVLLLRPVRSEFFVVTSGTCVSNGYSVISSFYHCSQGLYETGLGGHGRTPTFLDDDTYSPIGCNYGLSLQINTAAFSSTTCSAVYKCICFSGTDCTNTAGNVINGASCICGLEVCTANTGLYCNLQYNLCSKSSSFIKVTSQSCLDYSARPIHTVSDCDFAASALSLTDTSSVFIDANTIKSGTHANYLDGCYLHYNNGGIGGSSTLKLNVHKVQGSRSLCTIDRHCVCSVVDACTHTDGSHINTVPCACGTAAFCTTNTGLYCDVSSDRGGASGQCSTTHSGPWIVNREFGQCHDDGINGTSFRSAVDCRNAALKYGLRNTIPIIEYSTNRTGGCTYNSQYDTLYYNTNVDSKIDCDSMSHSSKNRGMCLCSTGPPICDDIYGIVASTGTSCRCGSSLCSATTGMYCFAKSSSCIKVPAEVATVVHFNGFRTGIGSPGY
jgi:hypothetical protein